MFTVTSPIGEPTIADGRDILCHLMGEEKDWRPSMNLLDLIQRIPEFVGGFIKKSLDKYSKEEAKGGVNALRQIGQFHLGGQYDINNWVQNPSCAVYFCQEKRTTQFDAALEKFNKGKSFSDLVLVVTESAFLVLEKDHKFQNVARMISWATLPALE
mmetsp:Transcript_10645/g.7950  ORF Transcript_10645/g.7950 Transcript_10645/m.7950 type:complete len:157 (+) Transcript_10645:225-695(+)